MNNEFFNIMTDGSKFSYESLQELNDINARTFSKLADIQMNFARIGIENTVEQAKLFTGARDVKDVMSAQSNLTSGYSEKVMELTREAADIMSESRGELLAWMEKRFEKGKQKAEAATQAATQTQGGPKPAAKKTTAKSGQSKAA